MLRSFRMQKKIIAPYKGAESEEKMKGIYLRNMKGGVIKRCLFFKNNRL